MALEYADVIVDLQYGDTGKGKVAHYLASSDEYNVVMRYNGGSNAGHTVYHNGQKIVTHQVPVGVLYGKKSIIGLGCVVNGSELVKEITELNFAGINTDGLIFVDQRAHIVQPKHIYEDSSEESIGTTRQGIGPTYRDKYGRVGMRAGEMLSGWGSSSKFSIVDTYELFHNDETEYRVLCEGAQGFHLDIDWGDYPYVTSSHCTVGSVCLNGIPPRKIMRVYGVMKAYETYVGNKTYFSDENNPIFQKIQEIGNEFGATTGRRRKVNWLNLDSVIQAINVNGVTDLIINKADVLKEVGVYKVIYGGKKIAFPNFDEFKTMVESALYEYDSIFGITWSFTPNGI